jgi:integrase
VYRIDLGVDPTTGKRRQISRQGFKNKKTVERALAEHLEQIRSGTHVDQSKMTTAEYLEQWLDNQKLRLKPTTWASYKTAADRVIARLGARAIQDLTPIEIEGFYSGLAVKGTRSDRPLKAKTIRNTHTILRKALSDAERLGIVNRNAAAAARPPIAEQVEQTTWSSDELRTFFAFTADDDLFAAYVLLATTGMRRGEALGLRWRDLDLDAAQLVVQQTLTTMLCSRL